MHHMHHPSFALCRSIMKLHSDRHDLGGPELQFHSLFDVLTYRRCPVRQVRFFRYPATDVIRIHSPLAVSFVVSYRQMRLTVGMSQLDEAPAGSRRLS
jgi:hypothetical protein